MVLSAGGGTSPTPTSRSSSRRTSSDESTSLLSHQGRGQDAENHILATLSSPSAEMSASVGGRRHRRSGFFLLVTLLPAGCLLLFLTTSHQSSRSTTRSTSAKSDFPWMAITGTKGSSTRQADLLQGVESLGGANPNSDIEAAASASKFTGGATTTNATFSYSPTTTKDPVVQPRCAHVMEQFHQRDKGSTPSQLKSRYQKQSVDSNVFYRATANIFWNDFVQGHWGDGLTESFTNGDSTTTTTLEDNVPLDPKSTFTWVTGDQHLSNFGAFRNRHGDIVFSVNDFDEAAIWDFQIDVLRVAISVYNHALTNGLDRKDVERALKKFTDTYVKTILGYIGNEDALLFELTTKTTKGFLKDFLQDVRSDGSYEKQMKKYTNVDKATGYRQFQKGPVGQADPDTKLAALPPEREGQIRSAFTATKYGATMMKLGWAVRQWDDDFFTILDVAARIGSGVGSSGVDRYYILLKGTDELLEQVDTKMGRTAVVLDVKFEPPGAVSQVLTPAETAWYQVMFPNAAARAVEAQRKLTSFTDPYTGWVMLPDDEGTLQPFTVRQRSPWKDSPNLDKLDDPDTFAEFMEQIAAATATSHVRGSVSKTPGDFKHVIQALLGKKSKRRDWGKAVTRLAGAYHEQVLLDFECFSNYAQEHYPEQDEEEEDNE
jgi:uncharacterized protein (DUF2252 family)